jgi:putative ABC transport system permease protein
LGVIIGVASVITIMAIGLSVQEFIVSQVEGVGSNLIVVLPGASDEEGPPSIVFGAATTLTYEDLKDLQDKRKVPEVEAAAGYVSGIVSISENGDTINSPMNGTTADYIKVENAEIVSGRFFSEDEEQNLSRVAVLGSQLAEDLFGDQNPINRKIEINNNSFTVIGLFDKRGSGSPGGSGQDNSVFIPLKTAQKLILGIDHLGFIQLKAEDTYVIENAKQSIKEVLRERHDINDPADDDFSIRDQSSVLETITAVTDVLRYFLLMVGSVSLVVGGIGIMNIMLIAVNQRIREVGLRKSLGAKSRDILFQFLIESSTISFIGGVLGVILGILGSFLMYLGMNVAGYEWAFIISPLSIIVAMVISIAIGLIFGMYPARKAAKISPMEALRYE